MTSMSSGEDETRFFFSETHKHSTPTINTDEPFQHMSLRLKSAYKYTIGPYQQESLLSPMENNLYSTVLRQPRTTNMSKNEYRACGHDSDIIIKPADIGNPTVIMDIAHTSIYE